MLVEHPLLDRRGLVGDDRRFSAEAKHKWDMAVLKRRPPDNIRYGLQSEPNHFHCAIK